MQASLESTAAATSVRVRNGEALVIDGPYAEAKESLGGYFLLSCDDHGGGDRLGGKDPAAWTGGADRDPARLLRRGGSGMMYAMLVDSDHSPWHGDVRGRGGPAAGGVDAALDLGFEEFGKADPNVQGRELVSATEAKVVRVVDGETIVTDGPFADTKELLGGVFVTDLPDLDEAIRIGGLIPAAEHGTLEIRPLVSAVSVALAAVFAEEWPRCVAILIRVLGDLERAEDAVQDAFRLRSTAGPMTAPGQPWCLDRHGRPQPRHRPDPA